MSRSDLHPEDLLDRARVGDLSDVERTLLDEHVAVCPSCAFELRVGRDFDREASPRAGDEALLARLTAGALERLEGGTATREIDAGAASARGGRMGRTPARLLAAAAVLVVVVGGAVAATYVLPELLGGDEPEPSEPAPSSRRGDGPRRTAIPVDEALVVDNPDAGVAPAVSEPLRGPRTRRPKVRATEADDGPSAAEFLARANAARGRGEDREAARLYLALQERYPDSREQRASRVALGRLRLDRLGEPEAALSEFEYYLARYPAGTLAEEARVGRALTLGQLGRREEERGAWRDLIENHPSSPHVTRARRRVDELAEDR